MQVEAVDVRLQWTESPLHQPLVGISANARNRRTRTRAERLYPGRRSHSCKDKCGPRKAWRSAKTLGTDETKFRVFTRARDVRSSVLALLQQLGEGQKKLQSLMQQVVMNVWT